LLLWLPERKDRLASLRNDFTEAMVVAAESLNKGLLADKPNAPKKAFVERLVIPLASTILL
jgi:hypothetical protein